jgi:hypothetical protein
MGTLQATEFASAVHDENISLESALDWHLTANHWPSLPVEYIEILANVIRDFNDGVIDEASDIALPSTITILPSRAEWDEDRNCYTVSAGLLIDITHCWPFIEEF